MYWLNEPPTWAVDGEALTVMSAPQTDFWRKTHNGHIADNGHFYFQSVEGDFTAEVKVTGQYLDLYDQAGLMVRLNSETWLKCGIEFVDGVQYASTVVTRDFSDWSLVPLDGPTSLWLRLKRYASTLEVHYSQDGHVFNIMRQAYFPPTAPLQVGMMICAPRGNGFPATFENFTLTPGVAS